MFGAQNTAVWVIIVAILVLMFAVGRAKTAFLGITFVFIYNVASSSLSAFICGRIFKLDEDWIDAGRQMVIQYSSWALLVMALAVLVAWWPHKTPQVAPVAAPRSKPNTNTIPSQGWVNPTMIGFMGALGLVCMIGSTFVVHIPTFGSAVSIFAGLLKVSILLAALHARKTRTYKFFLVTLLIFLPISIFNTLRSGFTPISTDLAIPLIAVLAFHRGINLPSLIVIVIAIPLFAHLMTAWLSVRGTIRSGALKNLPITVQASTFLSDMGNELMVKKHNPVEVQNQLFERIDMTDLLAQQASFQPEGEPYQYGMTVVNGLYALVPRFLWPDKPRVIGYDDFVAKYTGIERQNGDETAVGVPVEFELYANGGPICVWLGLFILTWFCATLERIVFLKPLPFEKWFPMLMVLVAFMKIVEQITLTTSIALTGALAAWGIAKYIHSQMPDLYLELMGIKPAKLWVGQTDRQPVSTTRERPVAEDHAPAQKGAN